ncbi:hypothetical protein HYW75_06530 [Candidatus Pacearchaeota archaeon]|nr:hypothetical protein [Candidatus Pacearchaeota archaeon]
MRKNNKELGLYEMVLREHIRAILLKRWPFNYYCGIWEKHKPDINGRQYIIKLNKTKGTICGKITLIHEITHILDDIVGVRRTEAATEDKAIILYERHKSFVDYLWRKYVIN